MLSDSANIGTLLLDTLIIVQFYDAFFWILEAENVFLKPRDS